MAMIDALLPCPFCGSEDVERSGERPGCDYYWICCNGCGVTTDSVYPDQAAADAIWNRRTETQRSCHPSEPDEQK